MNSRKLSILIKVLSGIDLLVMVSVALYSRLVLNSIINIGFVYMVSVCSIFSILLYSVGESKG